MSDCWDHRMHLALNLFQISEKLQQRFHHDLSFPHAAFDAPLPSLETRENLPHNRNLIPPTTTSFSPKSPACWHFGRMRNTLILNSVILTFILYIKHVSAFSPVLTARQSPACDAVICPNLDWLWENAAPAAAGFGTWLFNQFLPDDALTIPTDKPDKNRETPPSTQPDDELWMVGGQPDINRCIAIDFSVADNFRSDEGNTNHHPCLKTTDVVIYPKSCGETARNRVTADFLSTMGIRFLTIIDPICLVKGGVFYWRGQLTDDQVGQLKRQTEAVDTVVPNGPITFSETYRRSSKQGVSPYQKNNPLLKKRATMKVLKDTVVPDHLSFLASQPPGLVNGEAYAWLEPAGRGVEVFVVDYGFHSSYLKKITKDCRIRMLYASDASKGEIAEGSAGTCLTSLIGAIYYGVAKRLRALTLVTSRPTIASFIDGVAKVVEDLRIRGIQSPTKGRILLHIASGFPATPDNNMHAIRLKSLLAHLINTLQIVVVVAAGDSLQDPDYPPEVPGWRPINQWPALLAQDFDVISVGAVAAANNIGSGYEFTDGIPNGARYPWSHGSLYTFMPTVHAPGYCECTGEADQQVLDIEGTGPASAIVAGLVAYFLSLPGLYSQFREGPNTARAMRNYLQLMSYMRFDADVEAVWNGLIAESVGLQDTVDEYWIPSPPVKGRPPDDSPPDIP